MLLEAPPLSWTIRTATPADAAAIGRVHAQARREAYAGLLPPAEIEPRSAAERAALWRERLAGAARAGRLLVRVACRADGIVGFVSAGPQRDDQLRALGYPGEVFALYVLARAQGQGIGRALLTSARTGLAAIGPGGTALWAFTGNHRARRFYAHAGGRELGIRRPVVLAGLTLEELAYGWPAGSGASAPGG